MPLFKLTDSVNTKTLLNGEDELTEGENIDLFYHVPEYILKMRFED